MSIRNQVAIVGICLMALTGCQTAAMQGRPDFPAAGMLPPETQKITGAAAASPAGFDWSTSSNCNAAITKDNQGVLSTDPTYQVQRNNCIEEFIGAIDFLYNIYKEQVFKLANGLNATADTVQPIISAAAAGVGGSTAQILSGIAAGIGTLKGAINQDVLYNQTIVAIIAAMDGDRADTLKTILQRMAPPSTPPASTTPTLPYTMYAASVDLLAYFEAGTVHHAIVGLQSSSGAKAVSCQAAVKNIKTTGNAAGTPPGSPSNTSSGTSSQQAAGCS
jgi:hypothetical protein